MAEELVKVSELRAKFPMYDGVSDEKFLGGLRRKFYPDLTIGQFASRLDFDTERGRYDPTEGMSDTEKVRVGIGQGMTSMARGVGQVFGKVSREDVAQARKYDAPLLKTGAGTIGSITGQVLPMLATAAIPGANTITGAGVIGMGTGALAPSTSTNETMSNIGLGGLAGSGSILAGRAAKGLYEGGKALVAPLTKTGQEQIVANTLRSFSRGDPKALAGLKSAQQLVPGSSPTMAQASRDPGLAQLERTLVNTPEVSPDLAGRYATQRAARQTAMHEVAGTDEYFEAIKSGRSTFANEDYAAAMKAGFDQKKAQALAPTLEKLMQRPSLKEAQATAKKLAAETDAKITDFGSIEGLDWLKKGLDSIISDAKKPGSSIGTARLTALLQTKRDLMGVIEEIAPAYKTANDNFAAMSKQVNAMEVARDLLKKYEPASARYGASTRETLDAYTRALESAGESVKKATGMNVTLADIMPSRDIAKLEAVARDKARAAAAEELGRSSGSPTAQNLAAQNLLRRMLGPTGLPQSWTESRLLQNLAALPMSPYKLMGADKQVLDRLGQVALNPREAAALMEAEQQMARITDMRMLPPLALSGLFSQSGQQ